MNACNSCGAIVHDEAFFETHEGLCPECDGDRVPPAPDGFKPGDACALPPVPGTLAAYTHFLRAMRFAFWMQEQEQSGEKVTVVDIQREWRISRATAYRWLQRWRIAAGATP